MSWQFGPYRVDELIARGGMGEVWRAYDSRHDREIALKLLTGQFATDPAFQERFRREAHAVARLREPHVIPIHAYGEIDDRLYLDMRLVDGQDVAARLASGGPLEPDAAVELVAQVAQALDAAHAENLVHRDVKPSNIIVGDTGFAYLVDFGIAYSIGAAATALTSTSGAIGSMDYMAPERFSGAPVDHRVDVYSLACVLHQCLTGAKPFAGNTAAQLVNAHLNHEPPRPSAHRAGLPAELDAVVAQGMAKNPADRFTSAGALAAAARMAVRGRPAPPGTRALTAEPAVSPAPPPYPQPYPGQAPVPPPASARDRTRWWYAAAAVVVVVVLAAVGLAIVLSRQSTQAGAPPSGTPQPAPGTVTRTAPPSSQAAPPSPGPSTPSTSVSVRTSLVTSVAEQPAGRPGADLGLSVPLSTPSCDGQYVLIAGSAVTPARYRTEVQGLLNAHPGSGYLHAPSTGCGSLRSQLNGADVYAVYYGPYPGKDAACQRRSTVGGSAYVKILDNSTSPTKTINCG